MAGALQQLGAGSSPNEHTHFFSPLLCEAIVANLGKGSFALAHAVGFVEGIPSPFDARSPEKLPSQASASRSLAGKCGFLELKLCISCDVPVELADPR